MYIVVVILSCVVSMVLTGCASIQTQSLDDLNSLITRYPDDTPLYLSRAQVFIDKKQPQKAIDDCTSAIKLEPANFNALFMRSELYLHQAQFDQAIDDCNRALVLNSEMTELYMIRAKAYFHIGDFEQAKQDCTTALTMDSSLYDAWYYRSLSALNLHLYDDALADINRVISSDAVDREKRGVQIRAEIYRQRAMSLYAQSNYVSAVDDFTNALRDGGQKPDIHRYRGVSYFRLGEYDQAIKDLSIAIKYGKPDVHVYSMRGLSHYQQKFYGRAVDDFSQALELEKNNADIYLYRGMVYNAMHHPKAWHDLVKAHQLQPDNTEILFQMGLSKYLQENYEQALSYFNQALQLDPEHVNAHLYIGLIGVKIAEYWYLDHLQFVLARQPDNIMVLMARGNLYRSKGDYELSINDYLRVLQIDPRNWKAYYELGKTYILRNADTPDSLYSHKGLESLKMALHYIEPDCEVERVEIEKLIAKIEKVTDSNN